ncbi:MAG: sugar-binding transcriptional regulator [Rhodobacteraceae bacterium]|nr:sugar-binding transcriptional regulator [Paracoccaceae bacterium]
MAQSGQYRGAAIAETDLAARAAWLHFIGGLTQSEVAKRLELPTTRVHRYIARAQSDGLVRVFVDVEVEDCVRLETQLMQRYGLRICRVAMESPETGPLPLRALSALGGDYLMRAVASGAHKVIGVGQGRTLAAAVKSMGRELGRELAREPGEQVRFVSMLGGLTRSFAANPYDVIHVLAQKTGAEAYLMPAPLFADSAEDKGVLLSQSALATTMELIDQASLIVVGVGSMEQDGGATTSALDGPEAADALLSLGARAEILGQFLDANGQILKTPYDDRVMAAPLESLRGREVVAIAGGDTKTQAIRAALRSGLIAGLIIDEATARRLVEEPDGAYAAAAE